MEEGFMGRVDLARTDVEHVGLGLHDRARVAPEFK
jgi:hypothetical protein